MHTFSTAFKIFLPLSCKEKIKTKTKEIQILFPHECNYCFELRVRPCVNVISGDRISGWSYTTFLIVQDILHFSSAGSKNLKYIKTLQSGEALYSQAPNMRKNTGPTLCTKIYLYRKCAIIPNSLNVGQSFVDSAIRTSYLAWTFYSNSENLNAAIFRAYEGCCVQRKNLK